MYLTLKLIHIAAVVIFLGNIITGLFWHRLDPVVAGAVLALRRRIHGQGRAAAA